MSNKRLLHCLIILSVSLICTIGGRLIYLRHQNDSREKEMLVRVAQSLEDMEAMPKEDFIRVYELGNSIKQTNSISDADLDWWIQLVNRPGTSKRSKLSTPIRRSLALTKEWRYLTKITPEQKDKLFNLSKSYLDPPAGSGITPRDSIFGAYLAALLNEKRVAPLLMPYLKRSPESNLRQVSEKLLKRWKVKPVG